MAKTPDEKLKAALAAHIEFARKMIFNWTRELENLEAQLQAQETDGQKAKRLLDYFVANWSRKYPSEKYVVNGAKDMNSLKRLLRQLPADEIAARIRAYFRSTDPFHANARWSLPVFVASINALKENVEVARDVVGCSHDPRCKSDAEHTRRALQELRS